MRLTVEVLKYSGMGDYTICLPEDSMTRVVTGLLFNSKGKILIAKRARNKMYGSLWEFPGGKMEGEETVEEALTREILEEMSAPITINRVHPGYIYKRDRLTAEFIPVSGCITPSDIFLNEHEEHTFVDLSELDSFELAPFDDGAIRLVKSTSFTHPTLSGVYWK